MARILVVDDDPDFLEVTLMILEGAGHEVSCVASGKEALEAMHKDKPDLVLLDIMMSSILDGLGVSEAMHEDPELKKIPVIVVSSIAESSYAGHFPTDDYIHIDDWLSKPVQPEELINKVKLYLKRRQG